ncbi:MAG: hypothetical protein A6F71_08930 [Cycloclasticus sp. symbiont of Poecilosclerida sp. M]|nr:MAG: hypothetical protein A6F71_08930 [Cycloclasticus sp. symbiont of Poecilosclerida sp. M]
MQYTGGEDYTETIVLLTFTADNQANPMCVEVPIIDDDATELAEMFIAVLSTEEERVILNPDEISRTIIDNDRKWHSLPVCHFSMNTYLATGFCSDILSGGYLGVCPPASGEHFSYVAFDYRYVRRKRFIAGWEMVSVAKIVECWLLATTAD